MPWRKWGPYLRERQWGTVREDYSDDGNAWDYFSHDQARSRAYRWGEDGLAGISDDQQLLCFALALWNGRDPILKERLFGLTNSEGNHGEDVKEYYFYLDSTPTHSYMKYLYKYPQAAFPYDELVEHNRRRGRHEFEYELLDTGVFDEDRYFDVFVEYAKASPEDILIQITVAQPRPGGGRRCTCCRRSGSATPGRGADDVAVAARRSRQAAAGVDRGLASGARRALPLLRGRRRAAVHRERDQHRAALPEPQPHALRQGRHQRLRRPRAPRGGEPAAGGHEGGGALSARRWGRANPGRIRLRLSDVAPAEPRRGTSERPFGSDFDDVMRGAPDGGGRVLRRGHSRVARTPTQANVMRQALAGMLWTKQFYYYDVDRWLDERGADPFKPRGAPRRATSSWHHMYNADVISMPDKWEYPWYAAWDLAFHVLALTLVDEDFGKQQLELMLQRALPAPERPDSRLRVELRRRQPAGARLGDDLHLSAARRRGGARATSSGSSASSRSCCSTSPGG